MNHYFNFPGVTKWNPIQIKFIDQRGNEDGLDTAGMLMRMLKRSGYNFPHKTGLTTISKNLSKADAFGKPHIAGKNRATSTSNIDSKGRSGLGVDQTVSILQITPGMNGKVKISEHWILVNPLIKSINWGDLDYGSDDLVEYTLDVAYDWAELSKVDKTLTIDWKDSKDLQVQILKQFRDNY